MNGKPISNRFTVNIICKRYVKAFLENSCGAPVDLRFYPDIYQLFIHSLFKSTERITFQPNLSCTDEVSLLIPSDVFYRYGYSLTKEAAIEICKAAEAKLKFTMRNYVSLNQGMGFTVANSIRAFQENFNMPEPVWSYESIKKDFDRNGSRMQFKAAREIKRELNNTLMKNLTLVGLVSSRRYEEMQSGNLIENESFYSN